MKIRAATWIWSVSTVGVAALVAWAIARSTPAATPFTHSEKSFHDWLHAQLDISDHQSLHLAPHEKAFEEERRRLRREIRLAANDLALAIREGSPGSPNLEAALERLHTAQAQLQRLTLEHFFTMRDHLDPSQAERLVQWTHDNILYGPSH